MSQLEPTATPGLWKNPNATAAGVHALVIGISRYPHLPDGGGDQAPMNGGMGQLEVSARTAARVFDWLRRTDSVGDAPVASCRLLLSPRDGKEKADVETLTGGHYVDARYKSIREATEQWQNALTDGGKSGAPNVAFFFYSGHGVEYLASPALLAQDMLDPATTQSTRYAVALSPLLTAVKTAGIDRAFFFVDACRNTPEIARTLGITGQTLIEPDHYAARSPSALLWLQATRVGEYAFQDPKKDATVFGTALLEALEGLPPDYRPYDTSTTPWQLIFRELERHVKPRTIEILKERGTTLLQVVNASGDPYVDDTPVAKRSAIPAPPGAVPPPAPEPSVVRRGEIASAAPMDPAILLLDQHSASVGRDFKEVTHDQLLAPTGFAPDSRGPLNDVHVMHKVFDSEAITEPWAQTFIALDADTGLPAPDYAVQLVWAQAKRSPDGLTAWIDVNIPPDRGAALWIQVGGEAGQAACAVAIPCDAELSTPVRLDVLFRASAVPGQWHWAVEGFTARIAPAKQLTSEATYVWQPLWGVQRLETFVDLGTAAQATEHLAIFERALGDKDASPVAAAYAASMLLRAGALRRLHDWPKNLADRFPWLADGAVLWAETQLRYLGGTRDPAKLEEPATYFSQLGRRGVPLLSAPFVFAAGQVPFWRSILKEGGLAGHVVPGLTAACDAVENAAAFFTPGGAFAAYSGRVTELSPKILKR